jgi:hypothetical protein
VTKKLCAAALFAALAVSVFAGGKKQQLEPFSADGYRMDETGTYYQTISWTEGGSGKYDVEVERADGEDWTNIARETTENTSLELSLSSGKYRFRISTYNALGKVGAVSDWAFFEVLAALMPAAEKLAPASISERYRGNFTLVITGNDLFEGAEIVLVHDGGSYRAVPLSVEYDPSGQSISAVFDASKLKHGSYYVEITNPGGRKQRLPGFKADFVDVNSEFIFGWAPAMPLLNYIGASAPSVGLAAGLALGGRFSVVPIGTRAGWFGIEAEQMNVLKPPRKEEQFGYFGGLAFNLLYQYWFPGRRMAVSGRAGGGLGGAIYDDAADLDNILDFGVSFVWLPVKDENFFLEFGAAYYQPVSQAFDWLIDYYPEHGAVPGVFMIYLGFGGRY